MNFGIPFRNPFGAPFGVPFLGGVTGPVFPTAGNVGYYSAEDISDLGFSSANSVNFIDDQSSASNDLTQGTASANPLFIEHDTVTQFTLANQPTLKYDKEVSQDNASNQPTLVDTGGGVLAVEFNDNDDHMQFSESHTLPASFVLEFTINISNTDVAYYTNRDNTSSFFLMASSNNLRVASTNGTNISFPSGGIVGDVIYKIIKDGNNLSLFINGVQAGTTQDATGLIYAFDGLGKSGGGNNNPFRFKSIKQWNSADSSGTPDFELLPNASTMRKDDGTQPSVGDSIQGWHATGAELVMGFESTSYLDSQKILTPNTNFTVEWEDLTYLDPLAFGTLMSSQSTSSRLYGLSGGTNDSIFIVSDNGDLLSFGNITRSDNSKCVLIKNGNDISFYENDILISTKDCTGYTYSFDRLGRSSGSSSSKCQTGRLSFYNVAVSDPTNITETPDFELIPSEENCNVLAGQQVSRWNATSHKPWLNRLLSDGNDDRLEGMAVQTGDFTYMFKLAFNALSTTEYIFSHTTGLSAIILLSDNYIYLRDTTGANDIALTGHTVELGEHVYTLTREGDSIKYYVDSCLKDTIDVTGRTFELDTFGSPTDSLADLTADWGVWNRALTKEELDYFSYLRSTETNDILLPPLTPTCP